MVELHVISYVVSDSLLATEFAEVGGCHLGGAVHLLPISDHPLAALHQGLHLEMDDPKMTEFLRLRSYLFIQFQQVATELAMDGKYSGFVFSKSNVFRRGNIVVPWQCCLRFFSFVRFYFLFQLLQENQGP